MLIGLLRDDGKMKSLHACTRKLFRFLLLRLLEVLSSVFSNTDADKFSKSPQSAVSASPHHT